MLLSSLLQVVRRWFLYRETLGELNRLSDRDLADIDISRDAIPTVAWRGGRDA